MKVRVLYGISLLTVSTLLFGCTYTVYLPDDEESHASKNNTVAVTKPEFGNQCRYSGDGEYGVCPTSNGDMVGASCSCPTPSGQIMGTVSKY
jgi:3',5'-cyclic AMP phosphodiesterase CpdA